MPLSQILIWIWITRITDRPIIFGVLVNADLEFLIEYDEKSFTDLYVAVLYFAKGRSIVYR